MLCPNMLSRVLRRSRHAVASNQRRFSSRSPDVIWETTPNKNAIRASVNDLQFLHRDSSGLVRQRDFLLSISEQSPQLVLDGLNPRIKEMLQLEGFEQIYLSRYFASFTKQSEYSWDLLRRRVESLFGAAVSEADILEVDGSRQAILVDPDVFANVSKGEQESEYHDELASLTSLVEEVIELRIRPSVQADGGDVFLDSIDQDRGIAFVRLAGSCVGCGLSEATLKDGIERVLALYVPEIVTVEHVQDTPLDIASSEALQALEARLAAKKN